MVGSYLALIFVRITLNFVLPRVLPGDSINQRS